MMRDFEKLINANDLIEWIMETYPDWCVGAIRGITDHVSEMPSAQPEIVRCKDCEWFRKEYGWNCIEYTVCGVSPTHHPIRKEEDFCSYAERREEGGE